MITHYIFFAIYFLALARCADRYHRSLRKISNLRVVLGLPGVKRELILKEKQEADGKLKLQKRRNYYLLLIIGVIHEVLALIGRPFFDLSDPNLDNNHVFYPLIALAFTLTSLLVIFWLKGKGVLPVKEIMRRDRDL